MTCIIGLAGYQGNVNAPNSQWRKRRVGGGHRPCRRAWFFSRGAAAVLSLGRETQESRAGPGSSAAERRQFLAWVVRPRNCEAGHASPHCEPRTGRQERQAMVCAALCRARRGLRNSPLRLPCAGRELYQVHFTWGEAWIVLSFVTIRAPRRFAARTIRRSCISGISGTESRAERSASVSGSRR